MSGGYAKAMATASKKLGVTLSRHTAVKAHGPCPICGGTDRFVVWLFEEYAWCSRCGHRSWYGIDPQESKRKAMEEQVERARQILEIRAKLKVSQEWVPYSQALLSDAGLISLWEAEGMSLQEIREWGLGYADPCPVAPEYKSLTIPVFYQQELMDIRHRLLDAPVEAGKYRSHVAGLTPFVFNLGAVESGRALIVEGEKKAIKLNPIMGTSGISGHNVWEELLTATDRIYSNGKRGTFVLGFDPGSNYKAERLGEELADRGHEVLVADFMDKPDDMLLKYGPQPVQEVIRQARRL